MSERNAMTLSQMREKRGVAEVLFKKFTEATNRFKSYCFCFYEGEDGKYYDSRVAHFFGDKFISQVAGNKKEVLRVMEKIQSDTLYSNVRTMFFVDRDYDNPLAGTNPDLFETPCYSIENFYVQESVFCRILQSEFGLSPLESDYHKCLSDYRLRLSEFNRIIISFNAVVKYQHQYAPKTVCQFSAIKTSHLAHVEIGQVVKGARHDEQINKLISKLSADTAVLAEIESSLLAEKDPLSVLRGKNQLDFLVSIINELKNLNLSGKYFSKRLNNVHINLTDNRLSELSQYAITPPELITFLKQHST